MGISKPSQGCAKHQKDLAVLFSLFSLVFTLAEILLWCIDLAARHLGWQRRFQANTIRDRNVLSVLRLGKEVRRRPEYSIKESHFRWAWGEFLKQVNTSGRPEL